VFRHLAPTIVLLLPAALPAQVPDSSLLSLQRIYGSPEFRPETFGPARWLAKGAAYTTLERSEETPAGQDLVRYDTESGERTLLVPAARLVPPGDTVPLTVESYSWSDDERQLLIFTSSRPGSSAASAGGPRSRPH
jgi:dipeptidyl-peptidase-4